MEYFDYMRIKFECAFKFKDFCDSINKCRSSGSGYDENVLIKQFDFYNSCDKLPRMKETYSNHLEIWRFS